LDLLGKAEAECAARLTPESGRALIHDAKRWELAYGHARDAAAVADARVAELEAALETIRAWDFLNPPRADLLADLPWLRRVVDGALAAVRQEKP
jgi:hypothetical protein